jgi:hypothetical protein
MKISKHFVRQFIVATLSLLGIYVFTFGEFIISSTLFCTTFILSNLDFSDSLRTWWKTSYSQSLPLNRQRLISASLLESLFAILLLWSSDTHILASICNPPNIDLDQSYRSRSLYNYIRVDGMTDLTRSSWKIILWAAEPHLIRLFFARGKYTIIACFSYPRTPSCWPPSNNRFSNKHR